MGELTGSFYVIYEYKTSTKKEQDALRLTLKAKTKGFLWKANIQTEVKTELESLEKFESKRIFITGSGICGRLPKHNLDSLSEYIATFPDKVSLKGGCPSIVGIDTRPIRRLNEIKNKGFFDIVGDQREVLEECAKKIDSLNVALNNVKYIKENKSEFNPSTISVLNTESTLQNIQGTLTYLYRAAKRCSRSLKYCDIELNKIYVPTTDLERIDGKFETSKPTENIIQGSLGNSILIDSIDNEGFKTYDFRGSYEMKNPPFNGNYSSSNIDFNAFQAHETFPKSAKLVMELYDKTSNSLIETNDITRRPIIVSRPYVYLRIRCIVTTTHPNGVPDFWINENVRISGTNPLRLLIY